MTVSRLNPMRPRRFLFRHDGRKLVGFLWRGATRAEPYTVRLQPWGTIAGRLVDAQGQPRPEVQLYDIRLAGALGRSGPRAPADRAKTDNEGRFRVEGLVPGQEYTGIATAEKARGKGTWAS